MSLADELRRLQELHAGGALTDEEYAQAKARVINDTPATPRDAPRRAPERPAPERRPPERAPQRDARPAPSSPTTNASAFIPVIIIGLVIVALVAVFAFIRLGKEFVGKPRGGGLTLTVDRVESSPDGFRVHMTATNHTKDKLSLPLFGYFFVTDDMGNQYTADPFASTFPNDVAPGATVSGYAVMEKPLHPNATRLKVAFTTVFGSFAVRSAEVADVPVR